MGLMAIFQADPNLWAVLRGAALQLQAKKYACRRGAQNVCAGPTIAPSAKSVFGEPLPLSLIHISEPTRL